MISLRCSISKIILLLLITLVFPFVSLATEHTGIFFISKPDIGAEGQDPEVSWTIELAETGIKSSLNVSFDQLEEVPAIAGELGWEYRVEFDSITVLQDFHTISQKRVQKIIPLESVTDGRHIAVLTVRDSEGKRHTQTREFELNSAPRINAAFLDEKTEVIDPQITFSFLGERDGFVGMVDFYLDEQPLATVNISEEQNNISVNLSDLIGFQIYSADLIPGKHLLNIKAHGINGSSSVHALSITGSSLFPDIRVHHSTNYKLESLEIDFPASSKRIVGSAEVHYNQSTIFAVRTDQTTLSISRSDLIDALKKHNLEIDATPTSMIISARSANQVENWQMVRFQ